MDNGPDTTPAGTCVALLLSEAPNVLDRLNWPFANGYALVDRFDLGGSFVVVVKKM